MTTFNTLDTFDVKGKIVLVRADLNVPMQDGQVTDLTRISRFAPTARELMDKGARVVILSHFGRPKDGPSPEFSQQPLVAPLAQAIGKTVSFAADCIGAPAETAVAALKDGEAVLLENVRFHNGEEKNDPAFAKALAALGHMYVNDAFSAAHRAHASTATLAELLPAMAGRLMEAELAALTKALTTPERPLLAVVGGSKVSSKLAVLEHLIKQVNSLIIGGAMANTFLLAQGKQLGKSLVETDLVPTALKIMTDAKRIGCTLLLPIDVVIADGLKSTLPSRVVSVDDIPADQMALDIGPLSIAALKRELATTKTVVWNGPLGAFEFPPFETGTNAIAAEVARLTKAGQIVSVAGGGDTVSALETAKAANDFTYVSSAGGAFLEWLEGRDLPGVVALLNAASRSAVSKSA